jgi:uncharacterized protein (TIGR00369 family)
VITDISQTTHHRLRNGSHHGCVVCCPSNARGLGLDFRVADDGAVEASFACDKVFQGYPATLHGGIISTLLDGAMTNCMFAHGYVAVTAELTVRFRHPVATDNPATVRAWVSSSRQPVHELAAELVQNGQIKATAKAKFMEKAVIGWFGKVK